MWSNRFNTKSKELPEVPHATPPPIYLTKGGTAKVITKWNAQTLTMAKYFYFLDTRISWKVTALFEQTYLQSYGNPALWYQTSLKVCGRNVNFYKWNGLFKASISFSNKFLFIDIYKFINFCNTTMKWQLTQTSAWLHWWRQPR